MQPVLDIIQNCQWFPSHFLVISENVFSPLLYYSYFGAAIPTIIVGLLVFLSGKNKLENKLLFMVTLTFVVWMFSNLVTWATELPKYTMFFWTLLVIVEPFVYLFSFYFSFVFFFKKDFSALQKILFSIPLVPILVLAPTKFALLGYDLSNCDRAAIEGVLTSYGYILELIYAILIVIIAIIALKKFTDKISRRKIILVTIGITFFLLSFSLGNILEIFTENWYIGQYGLFGAPVFMVFLTFMIVRFKTFDAKLLGAQALVWAQIILIGSQFFFIQSNINKVLTGITLIISAIVGLIIIRSVKKEVAQREEIEKLAQSLESSNNKLADANYSLKDTNEKIELANEKLKELDLMKSEFVSLATHQIRGPLAAIKGYVSLMVEGDYGPVPKTFDEPLSTVFKSTDSLSRMVTDFLDVSRIDLGQMKYEFSEFDFRDLVNDVVKELKPNIDAKGLEFRIKISDQACIINADKNKLKQVLNNLIDNSSKYTKTGWLEVSVENKNKKILFAVKDSGVGISQKTLGQLFQRFSRAKNANETNILGTGLGLYIAKKMVEANSGKVWAESAGEGKGAQFYVEIPAVR